MSLEPKTFKVNNIETKDYNDVHFIPAVVDDKEVYEFLAKEEKETDFLHYGYMTKAMAEKLLSKREIKRSSSQLSP